MTKKVTIAVHGLDIEVFSGIAALCRHFEWSKSTMYRRDLPTSEKGWIIYQKEIKR